MSPLAVVSRISYCMFISPIRRWIAPITVVGSCLRVDAGMVQGMEISVDNGLPVICVAGKISRVGVFPIVARQVALSGLAPHTSKCMHKIWASLNLNCASWSGRKSASAIAPENEKENVTYRVRTLADQYTSEDPCRFWL